MEILLVVIGLLTALALIALGWLVIRWRRVLRVGGVNVALRWRADQADGWHLGIGRYQGAEFAWYRVLSMRLGPDRVLSREDLEIERRRDPNEREVYALPQGATVLCCRASSGDGLEIAMDPGALTGFLSWLESAPPGRQIRRAS